jgi:hypothetical protein
VYPTWLDKDGFTCHAEFRRPAFLLNSKFTFKYVAHECGGVPMSAFATINGDGDLHQRYLIARNCQILLQQHFPFDANRRGGCIYPGSMTSGHSRSADTSFSAMQAAGRGKSDPVRQNQCPAILAVGQRQFLPLGKRTDQEDEVLETNTRIRHQIAIDLERLTQKLTA